MYFESEEIAQEYNEILEAQKHGGSFGDGVSDKLKSRRTEIEYENRHLTRAALREEARNALLDTARAFQAQGLIIENPSNMEEVEKAQTAVNEALEKQDKIAERWRKLNDFTTEDQMKWLNNTVPEREIQAISNHFELEWENMQAAGFNPNDSLMKEAKNNRANGERLEAQARDNTLKILSE